MMLTCQQPRCQRFHEDGVYRCTIRRDRRSYTLCVNCKRITAVRPHRHQAVAHYGR